MFIRSIRGRLLVWLAFLLTAILGGFGTTAYQLHRLNLLDQVDEELERRVAAIRGELRPRLPGAPGGRRSGPGAEPGPGGPPPFDRPPPRSATRPSPEPAPGGEPRPEAPGARGPRDQAEPRLGIAGLSRFDEPEPQGLYFAVWSRSGTLLARSTHAPPDLEPPKVGAIDTRMQTRNRPPYREAFQYSSVGECVLVGRSVAGDLASLRVFAGWLVAAGAGVLALGLGGAWILTTRALAPIGAIGTAATRISAGNLAERIEGAEADTELGRLAAVLNSTFARLEAAFAQQKHFTADASHELRTPITVIISELQTTLARERSPDEYRQALHDCLDAAQQMRRLAESLLALARFDAGQEVMEQGRVDLADCAATSLDFLRPLLAERALEVRTELAPAPVQGDADRLHQVITNLLSNAIHYNRPRGTIILSTRVEGSEALVEVADTGPGIPAEDLPRVGERFFRADKARSRAEGRSGLGLAITKAIVEAHRGRLTARSTLGEGTTMTVRLPALRSAG